MLLAGGAVLAAIGVASVVSGPVGISPGAALAEIADHLPLLEVDSGLTASEAAIVWELRAPRFVTAALVGAMLAMAGAAFQGVFRNPLVDPYLLGAAAGAGLGATLAIAYAEWLPSVGVPPAAFVGALAAVGITYTVGRLAGGGNRAGMLLAGVAIASFFTAVQTFLQQRRSDSVRQVFGWILGRLNTVGWAEARLLLPYVMATAVVVLLHRRQLDVLAVGEDEAEALGLRSGRTRVWVVIAASLGTAAAVAVSGLIGFVGIVVPHAIRLLAGASYRVILPLSLLGGAAFLAVCDLTARSLIQGGELPIGVVTAFVGAPFFASLLARTPG